MFSANFKVNQKQASATSNELASSIRSWAARGGAIAGLALATSLFAASGAQAQNCVPVTNPFFGAQNLVGFGSSALSAAAVSAATITAANTAFLTQSTAFVSAPPNPQPGQEGGGVWTRGVGGDVTIKSSQNVSATMTAQVPVPPPFPSTASNSTTCATKYHETFAGFQVGSDIARLNIDGWNLHIGTTAGAIEASGDIVGGSPSGGVSNFIGGLPTTTIQTPFNATSQSPFVGTYVVATKGSFFADALLRYNNYDLNLNSPGSNLFGQKEDAHGLALSGSVGYNYQIPNSKWFIEPSAGFVWSRATVGALNTNSAAFGPGFQAFSGTVNINDISSLIGRAGVRVGTTVESGNLVLQPFVSASVWHEFEDDITATYQSCPSCFFVTAPGVAPVPTLLSGVMSSSTFGTYGQYSIGVSGQIANTGWLGFVRVDYRDGSQLQGLDATGGIRYQFTPGTVVARAMPVKAPVYKAPVAGPVRWTGWYVGGIAGADYGRSELNVPGFAAADIHPSGVLLGGTIGYNYQVDKYVLGIEADDSWTNYRGSAACGSLNGAGLQPFFQTTCSDQMSWIATVAGRAGYLLTPRMLTYLKGGVAFGHETWSATCNLGPLNGQFLVVGAQTCINAGGALLNNISAGDTRVGWTIGSGVEFALAQNWSAKGEWDWMDFGSKNLTASDGTVFAAKQWSVAEVKVGLNYHLH